MAKGRIGALIGWAILAGTAVLIAISVVVLFVIIVASTLGAAGLLLAVVIGLLGGMALAAGAIWIGTKLVLVPSVLMIERLTLMQSLRRSWSLTTGYFWRTFGILLLVNVMLSVAIQIITTPLSFFAGILSALINPNEDPGPMLGWFLVIYIITLVVTLLASAVAAIVTTATAALLYIDVRMRKEGLDLELTRFVEARQGGDSTVADPYLPRPEEVQYYSQSTAQPAPPAGQSPWA